MSLERLWAGWRIQYVEAISTEEAAVAPDTNGSLFERILASGKPDDETFIVHRGPTCFVVLNIYPYTNGHVLVLPNRAVAELEQLDLDEHTEMWELVRRSVAAIKCAYGCDGVNVGMNIGTAGGAGVPDHLHVHVLPRWVGDTNFMTAIAGTRVMPETLVQSWEKLRSAWE